MAKASHEKVLQKSMSDEEKTASLKMITGRSDDYSELFETALENINSEEKTPSDFSEARSSFFRSQIDKEPLEQEEKPPLLPKTDPPELGKINQLAKDFSVDSARNDSGFPNTRLSEICSTKISLEKIPDSTLELSHNIVTKDKQAEEGENISLVKARARLFESSFDNVSKSDVNRSSKVPAKPAKSTIPIVKLDDLENFDNFSKRTQDNETDDKKINIFAIKDTEVDNVSNEDIKKDDKKVKETDFQPEVDVLKISDITTKSTGPDIVISHKIKNTESKSATDEMTTQNVPDISKDTLPVDNKLPTEVVDLTNISSVDISSKSSLDKDTSLASNDMSIIEISDESAKSVDCEQKSDVIVIEDSVEKSSTSINSSKSNIQKVYPDDLNPFDDDDAKDDSKSESKSLNPFGSDDEEQDQVPSTPPKPLPTPRMKKKVLPHATDREFQGTPVRIERISVNPFESPDEEDMPADGAPPVPAARKKKVPAPKVSLNPFSSDDEENEDINLRQPVPKPR